MINPIISLGVFQIHWYGIILAASILVGYFLARKNSWKFGISTSDIDDYAFWLVVLGILGARVYYVLFSWAYFAQNPWEIYKIWHGGLAIYGALLAGLLFSFIYARKKAYSFSQLFDLVALSLPLSQAIGRFGNFVNQEAYGTITNLPWKIYIAADRQFHHPTFLYEAIWDVIVFLILWQLSKKFKNGLPGTRLSVPGELGWSYLLLYSLGRFFIEGIRMDSFFIHGFRVDQVVALGLIIVSGVVILRHQAKMVS